jgi:UDP-glucuronate 4-epimerase
MKILVTGAAGFIGYHLVKSLIDDNHEVIGLDNINNYYSVGLKFDRLNNLGIKKKSAEEFFNLTNSSLFDNFKFIRMNLEDRKKLPILFNKHKFDVVCNLAAQAGVRNSIENPETYVDSNIVGFLNILECCRNNNISRLVYASSSSVYGNNTNLPFNENHNVDNPISLYAASKKSNELMAYTYSHLFKIETIGLRFFTVYGSWGRPDMAYHLFTESIINDKTINIYNNGNLARDFTHVYDIVIGIKLTILKDSLNDNLYKLYNIGSSNPVKLSHFVDLIEGILAKKSKKKMMPMQDGDVIKTWANLKNISNDYGFKITKDLQQGLKEFINWYKIYNNFGKKN